ncbi:MAG: EutP/PduV family microcompartment system protein [Cyanobacteriota bacterium]|nr:EutP/PduV family microcompartment system protein [Cyanobacteriota bacterium]
MNRISVIGTSGSGKTTLARQIAHRLDIPHIELDALHWEPNWIEAPDEIFRDRVAGSLNCDRWVVDGNYSQVRDLVWDKADTIIWLNYSLPVIMKQLWKRTWQRASTRQELWNGNRETWKQSFFSRDSILLWALRTYGMRRREYPLLLRQPEYAHLQVVELHSPKETCDWILGLPER